MIPRFVAPLVVLVGVAVAVLVAVLPTSQVWTFETGDETFSCGSPLRTSFDADNGEPRGLIVWHETPGRSQSPVPDESCQTQSRKRLLVAGGVLAATGALGWATRPRRRRQGPSADHAVPTPADAP